MLLDLTGINVQFQFQSQFAIQIRKCKNVNKFKSRINMRNGKKKHILGHYSFIHGKCRMRSQIYFCGKKNIHKNYCKVHKDS